MPSPLNRLALHLFITIYDNTLHLLRLTLAPLARSLTCRDDLGRLRMRGNVTLLVGSHLLFQDVGTARGRDETQERGRWVQWTGREFRVGLQTDEEWVV